MNRQPNKPTSYPWAATIDGVQQRFTDGTTRWAARTWDTRDEPTWGVYGAQGAAVVNLVSGLKMGTSLADVSG